MKLSAVIIAHNEGDEVRKTVSSLSLSFRDRREAGVESRLSPTDCELEIIVIDDASSDDCCVLEGYHVEKIIRHDQPLGVGRSRNAGYEAASGDVISFHDAHMRFEPGSVEKLARKALETDAIVSSYSRGFEHQKSGFTGYGCDMFYNRKDGLQPKWRMYAPEEEWPRVPCMMGAAYFVSRRTAEQLSRPSGVLWEDTAGRWGFSEQALSVKAFLMHIPIVVSRDIFTRHLYRRKNRVPNASREIWLNVARSMSVLLDPDTFNIRFRPYCLKHGLNEEEADKGLKPLASPERNCGPAASAGRDTGEGACATQADVAQPPPAGGYSSAWKVRPDADIFTHLCGKAAKITERHEDHAWQGDLVRFLLTEGKHSCLRRILQWRAGESTVLIKRLVPDAEFTCIEMPGHRIDNWWDPCLAMGMKIQRIALGETYVNWPLNRQGASAPCYDLILIGGEMQEQCRQVAPKLLAPGGHIFVNDHADRLQIEDAERRKEQTQLNHEEHREHEEEQKQGSQTPQKPDQDLRVLRELRGESSVTVLLLSYKRPENIGSILDCLASQTACPRIILWNNAGGRLMFNYGNLDDQSAQRPLEKDPRVSLVVNSSVNLGCWPRWWLASIADTEFVCTMDDDLLLRDERVLEDAMNACRQKCPDGIVGFFGWERKSDKGLKPLAYKQGRHIHGSREDRRVDVIKGRFTLFRRDMLTRVPMRHPAVGNHQWYSRADDILISLSVSRGRPGHHLVPGVLGKRWRELGKQDGRANASLPGHYELRDQCIKALLKYYGETRGLTPLRQQEEACPNAAQTRGLSPLRQQEETCPNAAP